MSSIWLGVTQGCNVCTYWNAEASDRWPSFFSLSFNHIVFNYKQLNKSFYNY